MPDEKKVPKKTREQVAAWIADKADDSRAIEDIKDLAAKASKDGDHQLAKAIEGLLPEEDSVATELRKKLDGIPQQQHRSGRNPQRHRRPTLGPTIGPGRDGASHTYSARNTPVVR